MNEHQPAEKRGLFPSLPSMEVLILFGIFAVCCFIPSIQEVMRQRAEDSKFTEWEHQTTQRLREQHAAGKIFKRIEPTEFFAIKLF